MLSSKSNALFNLFLMSTAQPLVKSTAMFKDDQVVKLVQSIVNDKNEQPGYLYYENENGEETRKDDELIIYRPEQELKFRVLQVDEAPSRTSALLDISYVYRLVKSTNRVAMRRVVPTSTTVFSVSHGFLRDENGGCSNTEIFKEGEVVYMSRDVEAPVIDKPQQKVSVKMGQMVQIMDRPFTGTTGTEAYRPSLANYWCCCVKKVAVYYYWKSARNVRETQIQAA